MTLRQKLESFVPVTLAMILKHQLINTVWKWPCFSKLDTWLPVYIWAREV